MVIILDRPNFPPYVCISCGTGGGTHRKWFVSLNLPLDNYFNPVNEGNVFYCNECWDSLIADVAKAVQQFLLGHEEYVGVAPTFDNQTELLVGPVGLNEEVSDGSGSSSESVPTSGGTATDSNSSTVGSDTESSNSPAVNEFLEHFGTGTDSG